MNEVTQKEIGNVINGILAGAEKELQEMPESQLEDYWFFKWDDTKSKEWNTYQFHDLLKLYGGQCRRWEEKHNGSCCVVERVRDKYLMPKIREFVSLISS
jgi:hypothetical protein